MFAFDVHGQYETPLLVLCTPIREEMFLLTEARDITYTAVFDDLSQLEFEVSPVFSNGEPTPYFDYGQLVKSSATANWKRFQRGSSS